MFITHDFALMCCMPGTLYRYAGYIVAGTGDWYVILSFVAYSLMK